MSDYGFRDRLSAAFPSQVIIDVTEVCNLACIHCPHPEFKKSEHYAARYLDAALVRKAVDEIATHGAQYVRFTSEGEPLIHPGIYDMLQYAVEKSGTFVTLTTNGTTMNEKRVQRLIQSGLHMVDVSIDAFHKKTYDKIRIDGNFRAVERNVELLLNMARGTKTQVVVSFIKQDLNANEDELFRLFWEHAGATVVIRNLHSAAGAVVPVANILRDGQARQERRPCVYPWERIVLNPRGYLAFCPADWTHGSSMVDYRTTTIKDTWQNKFYAALRKAHLCSNYKRHSFCGQCPDWAVTRWPGEGRAYADLVSEKSEKKATL